MNGAWVLPQTEAHSGFLGQLVETVHTQGGSATVLTTQTPNQAEYEAMISRFRLDRAREYAEFAQRSEAFLAEIRRETDLAKFTFAELEEIEDDLQRLSVWLDKIHQRDFFPDRESQDAAELMARCATALRAFATEVYARKGVASGDGEA